MEIEIVKAEAELAGLQNDQPAAGGRGPAVQRQGRRRGFYSRPAGRPGPRSGTNGAKERFQSIKEKVRDLADPSHQKPLKDMEVAKKELDKLWKELKPELEAAVRSGGATGRGPRPTPG